MERVRILCAALLAMAGAQGSAQIPVLVLDAEGGGPIPYAHVQLRALGGAAIAGAVSGPDGRCTLEATEAMVRDGAVITATFIGFAPWSDTVRTLAPVICRPRRDRARLPEVVVTGQYAPGSPEAAVQRLRVIDAERIRRMAALDLGEALRDQLNLRLAQDNVLGSSVSMQGLGGENVKVLIDGVPVTGRQNGNVDLSQISLEGIERIELVEGPMSVEYGTNALAGTINLITRKSAQAPLALRASAYAEHIGRLNTAATGSLRRGAMEAVVTMGRNAFMGWDPGQRGVPSLRPQPADTGRYQQWKPREQAFVRGSLRWKARHWTLGWKGEGLHDRIVDRGRPRQPYRESAIDAAYVTTRMDHALTAEWKPAPGRRLSVLAAHNRYKRTRNTWVRDLTTLGEELSQAEGAQDTMRFTLTQARATFSSAPEGARLRYEAGIDINLETASGDRIDQQRAIGDHAAFASVEWRPTEAITVRPGARYAHNTLYAAPLTPSVNLRWRFAPQWTARAAWAVGFRAPSLKELHLSFVDVNHDITGNPDLRAERSRSASADISFRRSVERGTLTAEASAFRNAVSDLIILAQRAGASFTYANVGRLHTAGGSAGAGWDDGSWAASAGAAVTLRADDLEDGRLDRWDAAPELRASLSRRWERHGLSLSATWKHQGEQTGYSIDFDGGLRRGRIAGYHMADAVLTKRLWGGRLALSAGCKNIFDVRDLNATIGSGVHDGGAGAVPMATGRTGFMRLEIDLKRNDG